MELTIGQLAKRIGAMLIGQGGGILTGVGGIKSAGASEVTFVSKEKYIKDLPKTGAAGVIIGKELEGFDRPQLVVENVDKALIETLKIFAPKLKEKKTGVDPDARICEDVSLGEGVYVGAGAVLERGVRIGAGTIIASGVKIGEDTQIGSNCRIESNVVIYHRCQVGNNVVIQANSVIGSVGFGYSTIEGKHQLIPHNGSVVIEDFVEIGACCCVDRAKFDNTVIGAGTKIDNLVQIGHNVQIGKCCLMAGQAGIGGSTKVGNYVVFAGQSGVVDNIVIGDGAIICAKAVATSDIEASATVFGVPATDLTKAMRVISLSRRLPEMVKELKRLTSRIEELEASKDDKK